MGLDDVTLPRKAEQRIKIILEEADKKVNQLIEIYKRGELDANPGQTLLETLEQRIMATLAEARDSAGEVAGVGKLDPAQKRLSLSHQTAQVVPEQIPIPFGLFRCFSDRRQHAPTPLRLARVNLPWIAHSIRIRHGSDKSTTFSDSRRRVGRPYR